MDAWGFTIPLRHLHNFRVTPLCTGCTRLMDKQLQTHEFH
jgi:hypothetical protein